MIIDTHTHVYPDWLREQREGTLERDATFGLLYANPKARLATAEDLLEAMEAAGVAVSVMAGIGWRDPALAREVNDYLLERAKTHPTRLVAFCSVNPAWGQAAVEEVERCARAGARGIGELHPDPQGFDLADKATMAPLMEAARSLGLPVLVHTSEPVGHEYAGKGRTTPQVAYRFLQHFPDNPVICAHWGGGLPFYALMPEVREALANVYVDSAASPLLYSHRVFAVVARLLGVDRVLWATDFPLLSHRRLLGEIGRAGLTAEERAMALGGNAARLLGLSGRAEGGPVDSPEAGL